MMPDCVIAIPTYNAAGTLGETLMSIQALGSDLTRISEVVVADDCSTDDSMKVALNTWKLDRPPLRIVRNNENLGERETLNRVVEALPNSVSWMFILHADDMARSEWLSANFRAIDSAADDVGALTSSYDVLFPDGRLQYGENLGESGKVHIAPDLESIRGTVRNGCWFKISSCCLRVSAFKEVGGFQANLPQLGDWEYVLRLLRRGWGIDYLPLRLSVYRLSAQSVSSVSFKTHRDIKEACLIFLAYAPCLTAFDVSRRHLWYLQVLLRRSVSSFVKGDFQRLRDGFRLVPVLCSGWVACLEKIPKTSANCQIPQK